MSLIILNVYYINVFYYAATRQSQSDNSRVNQIVNRIRINRNYINEPIAFKIIGEKSFPVIDWYSEQDALNKPWSKYCVFKYFTDLNFTEMTNEEYLGFKKTIVQKNETLYPYPGKNSIIVRDNKAVLFLDTKAINREIEVAALAQSFNFIKQCPRSSTA